METKRDILSTINRRSGMTVPEGYFDDFAKRMEAMLPEHPAAIAERQQPRRTVWMRVRPYVYMAAMFAGIWCMLNIFNVIGSNHGDLSVDNNPVIATALSDDNFVDEYYLENYDTEDLLEDMFESGMSPDELSDSSLNVEDTAPMSTNQTVE